MKKMFLAVTTRAWRHPWVVLAGALLLTLAAGLASTGLRVDNSVGIWFVEDDPELLNFRAYQAERHDEVRVLAHAETATGPETWSAYAQLAKKVGFESVPWPGRVDLLVLAHGPFADDQALSAALRSLRAAGDRVKPQLGHVALAGPEVMNDAVNRATMEDSALFTGLSYGLIFLLLFAVLRRPGLIFFALWVITLALLVTTGVWGLSTYSINIVTVIVPILVLILAIADSVHVLQKAHDPESIATVLVPCFWTSLTTALGFGSLYFTQMPVIRCLGLFGAVGVVAAFLATVLVLPAGLALLKTSRQGRVAPEPFYGDLGARRALALPGGLVHVAFLVVFVLAVLAALRMRVDNDTLAFLPAEHVTRSDFATVEKALGGLLEVEVVLYDSVKAQALPKFSVLIPYGSARAQQASLDSLRAHYSANGDEVVALRGYAPLYARMVDYMVRGLVQSFAVAFVLVFVALGFFLRSTRFAIAAVLPNLFPIACTLGVMGLLDIPLDMGTVVIATLLLGLVVDDTIHLLSAYRAYGAMDVALAHTGSALVSTSLVLGLGFLVLLGAQVGSLRHFGILAAVGILSALIADLYWLPRFFRRPAGLPETRG